MKTTNKTSALDDHKLKYELTPTDPGYKSKKAKTVTASDDIHIEVKADNKKKQHIPVIRYGLLKRGEKQTKPKRQGIIKTYFKAMIEVILA